MENFIFCAVKYLEKLQCMHTKTHQIWNLTSQYLSKEILSDIDRKDFAEFNDKFYHFQYATVEIFKWAFNNYSMIKLRFFHQQPHFCNVLQKRLPSVLCNQSGHQNAYFIVELPQNRGNSMSILFYLPQLLLLPSLFSFERKIKRYCHLLLVQDK